MDNVNKIFPFLWILLLFFVDNISMNTLSIDFLQRIDDLIVKNNTKRQAVANYAHIRPQTISNWISQNSLPRVDTAIKIAQYLNTTVEYLVTGDNPPEWRPPARIAEIVSILETLPDESLAIVLKMVQGLKSP